MNAIAADAERMVKDAARPIQPGETVKAQQNRAARNLRYASGDWRVRAAWYREAGCWGAATFRDLQDRFSAWQERQEGIGRAKLSNAAAALAALRAAYASTDPDLYREQIAAIDAAIGGAGNHALATGADNRSVASGDSE